MIAHVEIEAADVVDLDRVLALLEQDGLSVEDLTDQLATPFVAPSLRSRG